MSVLWPRINDIKRPAAPIVSIETPKSAIAFENAQVSDMKILFVTHNYPRNKDDFSGVFLRFLARRLAEEGIHVSVLAPHDMGAPESEKMDGISIKRFCYGPPDQETFAYRGDMHRQILSLAGLIKFRRFARSFRAAAVRMVKDQSFDLIAAHWALPSSRAALAAAKAANVPLVVHSHGTDVRLLSQTFAARRFAASALKHASAWTVVSSYLKGLAAEAFPKLAGKTRVAPLPSDPDLFWPEDIGRRNPGLIVSVTRFVPQKRVEYLIDAGAILKERGVKFKIELYGSGPLEEELKQRARDKDLAGIVSFYGPVTQEELRAIYNRAGIIVLNSIKEGFGLTLVEGALCGCLPIGVRSGGIPDIIEHETSGFLAEPDDAESLANVLQTALESPERSEALSQIARQSALERFAGAAVARRYAEIYRNAAGKQSPSFHNSKL